MEKNYQIYVGIDVSKDKLDYCIIHDIKSPQHRSGIITNDAKGIKQLLALLEKKHALTDVLFGFENTGVYSMPLCYQLQELHLDYCVISALQVKRSKGISRGKNDKIDARDIGIYLTTHLHLLKLGVLPAEDLIRLKLLLSERERLVKSIVAIGATKENGKFLPKALLKELFAHNKKTVSLLNKQLKSVEEMIQKVIDGNAGFKQQQELLLGIPGIGKQTAVHLIVYTNGFTAFDNWRQFACYCGTAPFEYSSGSSVRGKTKVSQLANKKLKSLLTMCALASKRHDRQLKEYFERKVTEGKNKMSVINAVRCKLIARAFAVINRNTPFVDTLKFAS